jgi:hypothetical protein
MRLLFFLWSWWIPSLDTEGTGGLAELVKHASVERLEAAPLGGREIVGEREVAERLERLAKAVEALREQERAW